MKGEVSLGDRFPIRVYYADTDSAGIVYYATYMRWMEVGRCEFFRQRGLPLDQYQQEGTILVVARATLNYKRPARLGEMLHLDIWPTDLTSLSFQFNYQFLLAEGAGEPGLLVEATTLMVCVSAQDFSLTSVSESLRQALAQ